MGLSLAEDRTEPKLTVAPALTAAEIDMLLLALNDREGVLSTDWERAKGTAETASLHKQLRDVRALADKLAPRSTLQA